MTSTSYTDTRLLIDGQWCDAASGKTQDVINPATDKVIGKVAHAGIVDLDRALASAQRGFEAWRKIPANERAATMRKAAALLRERAADIGRLLTLEQGKPFVEARGEVLGGAPDLDALERHLRAQAALATGVAAPSTDRIHNLTRGAP